MIEFILQYWLEFLFGLIITAGSFIFRHGWKSYKDKKDKEQKEFFEYIDNKIENIYKRSQEDDVSIREEINIIKVGLLSIQGKQFRRKCKKLLNPEHIITLEEYEQLVEDHKAYNILGGNHKGDELFQLVKAKIKKQNNK